MLHLSQIAGAKNLAELLQKLAIITLRCYNVLDTHE